MSDVDRFKPTEAAEGLPHTIGLRGDGAEHPTHHSDLVQATEPEAESQQDSSTDDAFQEFREWCEYRRTSWPGSFGEFLSDDEYMLAGDISDAYPHSSCKTKKDYSWVPAALSNIFDSSLHDVRKFALLEYFLGLLSVLILSDATNGSPNARIYRELLIRTVSPGTSCLSRDPDFLGSLDPKHAHDPSACSESESEEIVLVRDLRRQLYFHTRNQK
jgi:hypothetical protein